MIVPQMNIFLTDIIGYDRLRLYLKIYTSQDEILGTPLDFEHASLQVVFTGVCSHYL